MTDLEEGIRIQALSTKGHSHGSMSYTLNRDLVFTGDAIPVENDAPIFVDYGESIRSLEKLGELPDVSYFCPAWDDIYDRTEAGRVIDKGKKLLNRLREAALQVEQEYESGDNEEKLSEICRRAGILQYAGNPLLAKSIEASL